MGAPHLWRHNSKHLKKVEALRCGFYSWRPCACEGIPAGRAVQDFGFPKIALTSQHRNENEKNRNPVFLFPVLPRMHSGQNRKKEEVHCWSVTPGDAALARG